jgi:hypothetical protein
MWNARADGRIQPLPSIPCRSLNKSPKVPECIVLDFDSDEEDVKVKGMSDTDGVNEGSAMPQLVDLYDDDDDDVEFLGVGGNKDSDVDIMAIIKPKTIVKMETEQVGETLQAGSHRAQPVASTKPIATINVRPSDSQTSGKRVRFFLD